jgi:hypothetical protein
LFDCPAEHAVIATTSGISARRRTKSPARLSGGSTDTRPLAGSKSTRMKMLKATGIRSRPIPHGASALARLPSQPGRPGFSP